MEFIKEKYSNPINTVVIGDGANIVKIGGESTMPFLFDEGTMPNAPVVALEIWDCEPADWPDQLKASYGDCIKDPVKWAEKAVKDFGAKALSLRLQSAHPDWGKKDAGHIASLVKTIAEKAAVPLIITGCGDDEIDNDLLPKVSQAVKGLNCLFGIATQNNYKTLAATCLADGHSIIAESPIDINIAKQVNILITDMGFDPSRIVMHPTTTSLGYGMEYVYSIMERARLAAFMGDRMLAMPFILFVGSEAWKTKEAKESTVGQGINWELATAVPMLQAGADMLVMRHPDAAKAIAGYIARAMNERGQS